MKKLLVCLICFLMIVSLFSCTRPNGDPPIPPEDEPETDPQPQELVPNPATDFEYEINSDQTGILINKYIGSSLNVVIPSYIEDLPVLSLKGCFDEVYSTTVVDGVFEGSSIKTVVIPETVKTIGYAAFVDCRDLTQIIIPANSNLMYIGGCAFENCTSLEKIDLSTTQLKKIEELAFRECINLKEIKFPDTLEEIKKRAFYKCSALLELDLPQSLAKIEGGAFGYCASLKRVVIPPNLNLTSLDEAIFYGIPVVEQIVFKEGREEITGYGLILTDANVEIVVPQSVRKFSPLPFFINPPANIIITFLGNAPEIVDNKDFYWFESATIYYDPYTIGWETFVWNEKIEMKPLPEN